MSLAILNANMGNEHRTDRSRAATLRDAALERVSRTRRWVIAGAALLTAGFAGLVAAVAPGRTVSRSPSGTASASAPGASTTGASSSGAGSSIPKMPPPASAGELGLASPNSGPSPDNQPSQPQTQTQSAPQPQQPSAPSQPQSQPSVPAAPAQPPAGGVVSGGS